MSSTASLHIRPARADDLAFLVETARRFVEFGPPPWREAAGMTATFERQMERLSREVPPGHALLVAESATGEPLGFTYLEVLTDFFTGQPHGHVSDLAVAPGADGRGVGGALLEAAEAWARARGYDRLTLTVFAANGRARALYARTGFAEESLRLVKPLQGGVLR
jgi:ribosomal protein S18 acetylase RimI-like enzyme